MPLKGFKPGQRKVMFTCIKRNLVRELKVAQLAGSVAELSSYHHGEVGTTIPLWLLDYISCYLFVPMWVGIIQREIDVGWR